MMNRVGPDARAGRLATPCERASNFPIPPKWVASGSLFFVPGAFAQRGRNVLCHPQAGGALLESAAFRHGRNDRFLRLMLLMPDHTHALIAPAPDKRLASLIGNWKRYSSTQYGIEWQKNFIDHRLRSDESWEAKAEYIRQIPVRAGPVSDAADWRHVWTC